MIYGTVDRNISRTKYQKTQILFSMKTQNKLRSLFLLDSQITYLNHGSFGACPIPIFENLQMWQKLLEKHPVKFFEKDIIENIYNAQRSLSQFINCSPDDIVFFLNPTTAINEIIRSMNLKKADEILSSDHEYGALDKAWEFICKKTGAKYIKAHIPLPIQSKESFINSFTSSITKKTKAIFLSHMTSSTGLLFPINEIVKLAKKQNILTIIDGAHIPGHIPLDLDSLGADIYTGTCHKWLLAPKGVSFLYVDKKIQNQIDPLVVSWGYDNPDEVRTRFQDHHLWQGTRDMSPYLTIPETIKFREKYHWDAVSRKCKEMVLDVREEIHSIVDMDPIVQDDPKDWLGQMCSFGIPNAVEDNQKIKDELINRYRIEIPVIEWKDHLYMRISLNGYNDENDVDRFLEVLKIIYK